MVSSLLTGQSETAATYNNLQTYYEERDTLPLSWKKEFVKELEYYRITYSESSDRQVVGQEVFALENTDIADSSAMAKAFLDLGDFYRKQSGYVDAGFETIFRSRALYFFRKAVSTYTSYLPENHTDISVALNRIGRFYRGVKPDSCFFYYKQVLEMRKSFKPIDYGRLGAIYNNLGSAHWMESDFENSYDYFLEAIETLESHFSYDSPEMLKKFVNLSLVCNDLGLYSKAIEYGSLALPYADKAYKAICLNNLGIAYLNSEQLDKAIFSFEESDQLSQNENIELYALIQGNLAEAFFQKGDINSAEKYYLNSNSLLKKLGIGYEYDFHSGLSSYATFLADQNQVNEAKSIFSKAINLSTKTFGSHHLNTIRLRLNFISSLIDHEQFVQADELLGELSTMELDDSLMSNVDLRIRLMHYELICLLHRTQKDDATIEKYFLDLERLLTNKRYKLFTPLDQIVFNKNLNEYFNSKVKYFYQKYLKHTSMESLDQLHAAIENAKSNALYLHVTGYQNIEDIIAEVNTKEQFTLLRAKIRKTNNELLYESDMNHYTDLQLELSKANNDLDSIIQNLYQKYPQHFLYGDSKKNTSIAFLQTRIASDEALVEYYESDSTLIYIFLTQDTVLAASIGQQTKWIKHVENVMEFISKPQFTQNEKVAFEQSSSYLYQTLLPDHFRNSSTYNKLRIIPHKSLEHFSFDVLLTELVVDNSNLKNLPFLVNQCAISYNYLADLSSNNEGKKNSRKTYGGFAPEYQVLNMDSSNFYDLPNSRKMMADNLKHMDGDIFIGKDCTKSNILKFSDQYDILHFSSHTHDVDNNGLQYKLLLADKIDDAYTLGYNEIMNLELDTKLVILSSCNTGTGEYKVGEGAMHLSRSFSFAGARSVLMSFWSIPEQETAMINSTFLKNMSEGVATDLALQLTKIDYVNSASSRLAHPYFWSGLAIIGNTEKISAENVKNKGWYFIVIIFMVVIFYIINKIIY